MTTFFTSKKLLASNRNLDCDVKVSEVFITPTCVSGPNDHPCFDVFYYTIIIHF